MFSSLFEYLKRLEVWRVNDKSQLLLSRIKPHVEVAVSTVSRWMKEVLTLAGIDTFLFKGHSTRSGSSSKAGVSGVSLADSLNQGGWSRESTWQTFYNLVISTEKKKIENSNFVLLNRGVPDAETIYFVSIVQKK